MTRAILVAWLLAGAYVGGAGWARAEIEEEMTISPTAPAGQVVCDGIEFATYRDCMVYYRERELMSLFPWASGTPYLFGLILLGFGFGALGGTLRVFASATVRREQLTKLQSFDTPLFGGLLGVLILGISVLVPAALTVNETVMRPTALLFLTMLGGTFSDQVYAWVEGHALSLFPKKKPGPDPTPAPVPNPPPPVSGI